MDTLIKTHYDAVCERYGEDNVFFVFLYGSQNYGIDIQDSDVDTKAVILLPEEELFWRQSVDTHIYFEPSGICQILDLVTFVKYLLSYDLSLLEVFISKHIIVNPKYEQFFKELKLLERELFDRDHKSFLRELMNLAKEDWDYFNRRKKDTTEIKIFLHAFRLISVAANFIDTSSYDFSMKLSEDYQEIFKKAKREKTLPQEFYNLFPFIYSRVEQSFHEQQYTQASIKSFQVFCRNVYRYYNSN